MSTPASAILRLIVVFFYLAQRAAHGFGYSETEIWHRLTAANLTSKKFAVLPG